MDTKTSGDGRPVNFEWTFGMNRLFLDAMGVWPDDRPLNSSTSKARESLRNARVPVVCVLITVFLFLPQLYAMTKVINELPFVVDNALTNTAVCAGGCELFVLWIKKRGLRAIVRATRSDWERPGIPNWEYEIMEYEGRKAHYCSIIGVALGLSTYVGFVVGSIFQIEIRMINNITDFGERHLFLQSYYPYDYSPTPIFELTNFSQVATTLFISFGIIIPANYFCSLCFHISGQMNILALQFGRHKFERSGKAIAEVCRLVQRHIELYRTISIVNDTFKYVIICQLGCVYVSAVCSGLDLLYLFFRPGKLLPIQLIVIFSALTYLLVFFFFVCYSSEYVNEANSNVNTQIYNGKWLEDSIESKKYIIPILMYSSRPLFLTAGGAFPLSLKFFCSVVNSIGGYISLLFAVYKQ